MANYYLMRILRQGVTGGNKCWLLCFVAMVTGISFLPACASSGGDVVNETGVTSVTLPNGKKIIAEAARTQLDLLRGLMFRDSMPAGRGMLFTHPDEGIYHYWMYQVKFPLDIIWMDHDHRIVEMSLRTPPCPSKSARECPNFGGNFRSRFVLELNAGVAETNQLTVGQELVF